MTGYTSSAIDSPPSEQQRRSSNANVVWHASEVSRQARWRALGQQGATAWFTGLPASGKSTLAAHVEHEMISLGRSAYLIDGDNLRHGLCADLGFQDGDRDENVRRASELARLFADAGTVALVALVSPYSHERDRAREIHRDAGLAFVEVFVNTPLQECEARDPKGLYRRARSGSLRSLTGVDAPYEPPTNPDVEISPGTALDVATEAVIAAMARKTEACRPRPAE